MGDGGCACADGEVRHHKRSSGQSAIWWIVVGPFPLEKEGSERCVDRRDTELCLY